MNDNNLPARLDFNDPKMIETIKRTVAQGATNEELAMFLELCKASGLNPFKREVWLIKTAQRAQIMTGIGGFMAIANSHPMYDGMEVEVDDDENPTKAICKVWRKDRKFPSVGVALMKEYRKSGPTWQQMPRVMLTKVAKSIAIREAFPQELNGLYTVEEMPDNYSKNREMIAEAIEGLPKREAKTYRYNMEASKKFIEPGQEAAIKARLKKDYGATFDKESGELVTKKPINGWDEALSINIKEARAVHDAMGDDDLPTDINPNTGEVMESYNEMPEELIRSRIANHKSTYNTPDIDDEAESHFAGLVAEVPKNVLSKKDAKAVVEKMKKTKGEQKPFTYEDKDINI